VMEGALPLPTQEPACWQVKPQGTRVCEACVCFGGGQGGGVLGLEIDACGGCLAIADIGTSLLAGRNRACVGGGVEGAWDGGHLGTLACCTLEIVPCDAGPCCCCCCCCSSDLLRLLQSTRPLMLSQHSVCSACLNRSATAGAAAAAAAAVAVPQVLPLRLLPSTRPLVLSQHSACSARPWWLTMCLRSSRSSTRCLWTRSAVFVSAESWCVCVGGGGRGLIPVLMGGGHTVLICWWLTLYLNQA
jgi:hypothetical protein